MTFLMVLFVTGMAVGLGVLIGLRRSPLAGLAATAGVLVAGALGYFALLTMALPM